MISNKKMTSVKHLPQLGASKYNSILVEFSFDIVEVLTDFTKEENKIPKVLMNLIQTGNILRAGRANTSFMHNFIGLFVWKHMNSGRCWMNNSDLDPIKNLNTVE